MAIKHIILLFVETPRKFITAKLSIRKPGSSSMLIICDLFNSHALLSQRRDQGRKCGGVWGGWFTPPEK